MRRQAIFASLVICVGLSVAPAFAKTVRCETLSKTDRFVPDWIEYTVRETDVDVKDSVQRQHKSPWQPGRVAAQTAKRTTIAWEVGPINSNRLGNPSVLEMRLSHFSDGTFRVTVNAPQLTNFKSSASIEGKGRCK